MPYYEIVYHIALSPLSGPWEKGGLTRPGDLKGKKVLRTKSVILAILPGASPDANLNSVPDDRQGKLRFLFSRRPRDGEGPTGCASTHPEDPFLTAPSHPLRLSQTGSWDCWCFLGKPSGEPQVLLGQLPALPPDLGLPSRPTDPGRPDTVILIPARLSWKFSAQPH